MYIRTAADIGNMIKAYRLQAKLSQTELAQRVGTTQGKGDRFIFCVHYLA